MAANVPERSADGTPVRLDAAVYGAFENAELTPRGRRQAERAAAQLGQCALRAAYASPFRRAVATAEAVAAPHGLQVVTDDAFGERSVGEWDGLTAAEIAERDPPGVPLFDTSSTFAPPGGESLQQVVERAYPALLQVAQRHAGQAVALVSHKTVNRVLICHIVGMPLQRYRRIGQATCALNVLHAGPEGISVTLVNDTCHSRGLAHPCD